MDGIDEFNKKIQNIDGVCPYCKKPFVERTFSVPKLKKDIKHFVPDCDCVLKIEEKERIKKEQEIKARFLQKRFDNSMMSPFFREKRFENFSKGEHLEFCRSYAQNFKPKGENGILMIGNIGTGKTTLQACICDELIKQGYNCLFTTLSALLEKLTEATNFENKDTVSGLLSWLCQYDYVVLDDIGREKYTESKLSLVFRIVDELMNNKVTLSVTANPENIYKLSQIDDFKAVLDRIHLLCPIRLNFKGESYRRKDF